MQEAGKNKWLADDIRREIYVNAANEIRYGNCSGGQTGSIRTELSEAGGNLRFSAMLDSLGGKRQKLPRNSSSLKSGQGYAAFESAFPEFVERHFVPNVFPYPETLYPRNVIAAHSTNIFYLPLAIRRLCGYRDPKICQHCSFCKNTEGGLGLGILRSLSKLDVQNIRSAKKWGFFLGAQILQLGVDFRKTVLFAKNMCSNPQQIALNYSDFCRNHARTMVTVGI